VCGWANVTDLADVPTSVGSAFDVDDEIDRGREMIANGLEGQSDTSQQYEGFQTPKRIFAVVGVNGRQRTVMAGVHGLDEFEGFRASDFAEQNPIGSHTQCVAAQFACVDRRQPFVSGWSVL